MNLLVKHIRKYVTVTEEQEELILSRIQSEKIRKKTVLQKEGQVSQSIYFVEKGLLRNFFINEKGAEQTCQFALENWWIGDFLSFDLQTPSHFSIQSVEDAEIIILTKKDQQYLLTEFPELEKYFRIMMQRSYGALQLRIKYLYDQSGEERYRHFSSLFPGFIQRIPQYMLASYLGFSPEFLSKIRAGKV